MPNNRLTTARRQHTCCLCFEPIPAGSQYISERVGPHNSDNDRFWTYRAHPDCDRIWNEVQADELCDYMPTRRGDWNEILEAHAALPEIRAEREQLRRLADECERQRRQMAHA